MYLNINRYPVRSFKVRGFVAIRHLFDIHRQNIAQYFSDFLEVCFPSKLWKNLSRVFRKRLSSWFIDMCGVSVSLWNGYIILNVNNNIDRPIEKMQILCTKCASACEKTTSSTVLTTVQCCVDVSVCTPVVVRVPLQSLFG